MIATVEWILFFAELHWMPPLAPGEELLEGGVVKKRRCVKPRHKLLRRLRGQ